MEPVFESVGTHTLEEYLEFLRLRERAGDIHHYELLRGKIVMTPPAGWPHGSIEGRIVGALSAFVRSRDLGEVFGSSQGFHFPSNDVVEPDVSFVTKASLSAARPEPRAFLRVVPDLIVEILSSNRSHDLNEKRAIYEQQGVGEYWIVDPGARTIGVLLNVAGRFVEQPHDGTTLRSAILTGFSMTIAEAFPS